MKTCAKNLFPLPVLMAVLGLISAGRVTAQTFTTLHSFDGSDGVAPSGSLVLSGSTLYGTAMAGGSFGFGAVFKLNTDGTGLTNLHSFTATSGPTSTNSDGSNPRGGLVLSSNTLYGTASYGGGLGYGTVFKVNTDGTGFTNLYSFDYLTYEISGLVLSSNTLYGTTDLGGNSGSGSVFAIKTDGTGFTNLHSFAALCNCIPSTNSDGAYPIAALTVSGSTLYGTTAGGGMSGCGTVFKLNTDGTGFTNIHHLSLSDGCDPNAGVVLSGHVLYGAAMLAGGFGNGTIFAVNTDGTDFRTLHNFTGNDGLWPATTPFVLGSTLYGTTAQGGNFGNGTVFKANTDGTGFDTLYNFTVTPDGTNSDGGNPLSNFCLSENTLYGTALYGGSSGKGTVFSLSFPPRLTIISSGPYVVLTWPTNYAGFDYTGFTLQSTANLLSPVVWSTVSPGPVVIGGQNVVINTVSGSQKFYRLRQ